MRIESICETLHASFDWQATERAWLIPPRDLPGVSAWLAATNMLEEADAPSSAAQAADTAPMQGDRCIRILVTDGRLRVVATEGPALEAKSLRAGYRLSANSDSPLRSAQANWFYAGTDNPEHKVRAMWDLSDQIDGRLADMRELGGEGTAWHEECLEKLIALGMLGGQLFADVSSNEETLRSLFSSFESGSHVVVESDDEVPIGALGERLRTRDLPFHLMCTDPGQLATGSGQEDTGLAALSRTTLGLRLALGVSDRQRVAGEPFTRAHPGVAFLLGDWRDRKNQSIGDQLEAIREHFQSFSWDVRHVDTIAEYRGLLRERIYPDVIHVAGHNASGAVRLAGRPPGANDALYTEHLSEFLSEQIHQPPRLVFLNTCSAAKVTTDASRRMSLSDVVLGHAATCCVATVADLDADQDVPGVSGRGMCRFAEDFYQELLSPKSPSTVGEALRRARLSDHTNAGLVWTKYVLLGNPAARIVALS